MTEANFVQAITTYLREEGAKVFKHNDGFTVGIPDLSVTFAGKTTWLEAKVVLPGNDPISRIAKDPKGQVQLKTMRDLGRLGRAMYVIWDRSMLTFWPPEFLAEKIILVKNPTPWTLLDYCGNGEFQYDDDCTPTELIYSLINRRWNYPVAMRYELEHVKTLVEV